LLVSKDAMDERHSRVTVVQLGLEREQIDGRSRLARASF
jgi:hypothetical protein